MTKGSLALEHDARYRNCSDTFHVITNGNGKVKLIFRSLDDVTFTLYRHDGGGVQTALGSGKIVTYEYSVVNTDDKYLYIYHGTDLINDFTVACDATFTPSESLLTRLVNTTEPKSKNSFVTTDTIQIESTINLHKNGVKVMWTVKGGAAAAHINNFPKDFVTFTNSSGKATFIFTPSSNEALMKDRRENEKWIGGSTAKNLEITFDVIATTTVDGDQIVDSLSSVGGAWHPKTG